MNPVRKKWGRSVLSAVVLLLAVPFLAGAYRGSCNRSVGVWPNYPFRGGNDAAALEYTDTSGIAHVFLFVGWMPDWYTCTGSNCTFKAGTGGLSALQNYVFNGIQSFSAKNYGRQYNVNVVLNVHQAYGSSQVGPNFLHTGGQKPASDPTIVNAFKAFYDQIYHVMAMPDFHDTPDDTWTNIGQATWMISIGNEIDNFMLQSSDWSTYKNFATAANTYIKSATGNPSSLPVLTGVTQTYYGSVFNANPSLPESVHTVGDVITFTYYPLVNCNVAPNLCPNTHTGVHMAEPSQVSGDFNLMMTYRTAVNAMRSSAAPIFLQEVGYPTGGTDWLCPDSLGNSCTTAQKESYQATFVDQVFSNFNAHQDVFKAFTWWSLFDYDSTSCAASWPGASHLCWMGLRRSDNTAKPAYSHFATGAKGVTQ